MTNEQIRITNEAMGATFGDWSFDICHSFVIRISSFVIVISLRFTLAAHSEPLIVRFASQYTVIPR